MDVLGLINGGYNIPNPKYKDTKNNTEPKYNHINQIGGLADINFSASPRTSFYLGRSQDNEKYRRYGITPNIVDTNLDEQLINAQGFFDKMYNSLARTLVSEIGIGTAEGFSDLLGGALQIFSAGNFQNVTDNAISNYLEEVKRNFDESHAIYRDQSKNLFNGGLIDAGWWFDNLPSVASSLTLLIPSTAATKAISYAGKGVGKLTKLDKLGKALGTVEKAAANGEKAKQLNTFGKLLYGESEILKQGTQLAINAGLQRTMENYQESRQVFNDTYHATLEELNNMSDEDYEKFINTNSKYSDLSKTDIAKDIANTASDLTFKVDYLNLGFDILQLATLRNLWKGFKTSATGSIAAEKEMRNILNSATEAINKAENATNKARKFSAVRDWISLRGKAGKAVAASEASEGIEEAINYIAQEEGMHLGKVLLGNEKENKLGDRIGSYISDGRLWDSAFWGWMGGIIFQGIGGSLSNFISSGKWQTGENEKRANALQEMDTQAKVFAEKAKLINEGKNIYANPGENEEYPVFNSDSERETALNRLASEFMTNIAIRQMNAGNLGYLKQYLEDKNVQQMLIDKGIIDKEGSEAFFAKLRQSLDKIENNYDNHVYNAKQAIARLKVNNQIDGLNITPEQIQLLATENLRTETQISDLNDIENQVLSDIDNQEKILRNAGELDPNIDYKQAIRLKALSGQIGMLQRQLEEIKDKKDAFSVISKKKLQQEIDQLKGKVSGEVETAFVNWLSSTVTRRADGKWEFNVSTDKATEDFMSAKEFKDVDDKIIRNGFMGAFNVMSNNFDSALSDFKKHTNTAYLAKLYEDLPFIDIYRQQAQNDLAITDSQIRDRLYKYDELFTDAKNNLASHVSSVLSKIAKETSIERASELLGTAYENISDVKAENFSDISEGNLKDFLSTLNALQLDKSKDNIFEHLQRALLIQAAQEAALKKEEETQQTQNSTTQQPVQNPIQQPIQNPTVTPQVNSTTPVEGWKKITPNNDNTYNVEDSTENNKSIYLQPTESGSQKLVLQLPTDPDVRNQLLTDENLYDREDGIDMSKELTSGMAPFVSVENGKLKVIRKGLVRNVSSGTNSAPTTTVTPAPTTTVVPPSSSSTGVGKSNIDLYDEEGVPLYDVGTEFIQIEFAKRLPKANLTVDTYEEFVDKLIDDAYKEVESRGYQQDDYRQELEDAKEAAKEMLKEHFAKTSSRNSAVAECYIYGNPILTRQFDTFENAYTQLIEQYINDVANVYVEGTGNTRIIYINSEALLRYIAESSICKPNMIPVIYQGLMAFLETKQDKYIVTDSIKSLSEYVNNLNKTADERIKEIASETTMGVNLDILNAKDENQAKASKKSFNKLEIGSKLTVTPKPIDGNRYGICKGKTIVGTITMPSLLSSGNGYNMPVECLAYQVWKDTPDGEVQSNLKQLFVDLFATNKYNDAKQMVYEVAFKVAKLSKESDRKNAISALGASFGQTDFHKVLVQNDLLVGYATYSPEIVLKHLAKLLRYTQQFNINNVDSRTGHLVVQASLDSWFTKLYNSYKDTETLISNPDKYEIQVADINEGELVVTDVFEPTSSRLDKRKYTTDISNEKRAYRIAAVSGDGSGTMFISGKPNVYNSGMKANNTFFLIPTRRGFEKAHLHPVKISDINSQLDDDLNDIVGSAKQLFIDAILNKPSHYNDFVKVMKALFNEHGLFRGIKLFEEAGHITLVLNNNERIRFYEKTKNGKSNFQILHEVRNSKTGVFDKDSKRAIEIYSRSNAKELNDEVKSIVDRLFGNDKNKSLLSINISHELIKNDSKNSNISFGIVGFKDGKFVVNIDNPFDAKHSLNKEYGSYSQFILDHNAATTAVAKKHFTDRSDTNTIHQKMDIKLINKDTKQQAKSNTEKFKVVTEQDKLQDKLNDATIEHKGEALVQDKMPKSMLNSLHNLELLPKNVIFVSALNPQGVDSNTISKLTTGEVNASVDLATGVVAIGQSLLDKLASNSVKNNWRATRILIHEQLHLKLHSGNENVITSIKGVFNEFKEFLNAQNVKSLPKEQAEAIEHLKEYLFENEKEEVALEEFLVESLTNQELITALNQIQAKPYIIDNTKHSEETLFEKIFNLLNEVFKWFGGQKVNDNSLLKKELDTLAGIVSDVNKTSNDTNNTQEETNLSGKGRTRGGRGRFRSSITESNANSLSISAPTISTITQRVEGDLRANFLSNINSAEFEYHCR